MTDAVTGRPRRRVLGTRGDIAVFLLVAVIALFFLFPLLWMILTAFRTRFDVYKDVPTIFPRSVTLENFTYILQQQKFLACFLNSIVVTVGTVTLVVLASIMGGYAFGMRRFRGQQALFYFVTLVLAIPYVMYLIPVFIMMLYTDLRNTWLGLILPYVALNLPWGLLIMRGAFSTIPIDLRDAATIDGCGEFRFVFGIVTPILKPAVAAATIITFVFAWEELMFSQTINSRNYTLPVYFRYLLIETQGQEWGKIGAVVTLTIIPVLVLFIAFRKFFIKGLSEGMIKG